MWYHWNSFRGSWGIWHPQLQSRRSDCFIWDHFSTGYTPGSRGGHGDAVHCEWVSPSSVAAPSAPGWTLPFYGPGVPLEQVSRDTVVTTGVTHSSSHCALFAFRGSSIVQPTRSHDSSYSPESGDSILRRSGWSGVDSGKLRWTCLLPLSPPTASCTFPWPRAPSAQTHWHTAGLGPYASMRFPQWAY